MMSFIMELRAQLLSELNKVSPDNNTVKDYDHYIELIMGCIRQLRKFLANESLPDKEAEIYFFKQEVPFYYCKFFYFVAMRKASLERRTRDEEGYLSYLHREKEKIALFIEKYHRLHMYYHSGSEDHDGWYTRRKQGRNNEHLSFVMDEYYCKASIVTGKLLAFEEYRRFIDGQMDRKGKDVQKNVKIKLSKSEAVEFIMTLYEDGIVFVDEKQSTIEQVAETFIHLFPFSLDDITSVDYQNRTRRKDATPLLHRWLACYERRMKRLG